MKIIGWMIKLKLFLLPYEYINIVLVVLFFLLILETMAIIGKFINRRGYFSLCFEVLLSGVFIVFYYLYSKLRTNLGIGNIFSIYLWRDYDSYGVTLFFVFLFFCFIRAMMVLMDEYENMKNKLSILSVKEAIDNINDGIIFAKTNGSIILSNHTARKINSYISQDKLNNANVFWDIVKSNNFKINQNGKIWSFEYNLINKRYEGDCFQITCKDITKIESLIEELNEKIREKNLIREKQMKVLKTISTVQKQEALLQARLETHAKLGLKVSIIDYILESNIPVDNKIRLIQENLSKKINFTGEVINDRIENLIRSFKALELNITVDGKFPNNNLYEEMLAVVIKESAINAINHAKAKNMSVKIVDSREYVDIIIENDGKLPDGNIQIGGGLTSIQRNATMLGGTMKIETDDKFRIIIVIDKKSNQGSWIL